MPAGESIPPRAIPLHVASRLCGLPKGEVAGVALQGVGFGADTFQQVGPGVAGELAVVEEAGNIEVDVTTPLIGVTFAYQRLDDGEHLRDVMAGPRENMGLQDVQPFLIAVEPSGVQFGDLLHRLAFGKGGQDHLVPARFHQLLPHVADVGDVLDVLNFEAMMRQGAPNPVGHHVGAQVADVGVPVHRRPAGVHTDNARLRRFDFFYPLSEGIVYVQQSNCPLPPNVASLPRS